MKHRLFTAALLALLLQGGYMSGFVGAAQAASPVPTRPALPSEACNKNEDGFATFLEAFASDPTVRAAYSAPHVAERDLRNPSKSVNRPNEPFRLAVIDSRWSYDEPGKDVSALARVKLDIKPVAEGMRADIVKARFSPDDNVVKPFGAPEAYVFEYVQQCWQLTQHLR